MTATISPAVLVLIVGLGLGVAALVLALVWALIDNRFIYKRRVPPDDDRVDRSGG